MNNLFAAKLLQNLRNKKGEKGFTLIELLVVVIIIGVLAAVALPNLLAQVGKARESEAKTALGALNRSQQAYHLEARSFFQDNTWANVEDALGVVPGSDFYLYASTVGTNSDAEFIAVAVDPDNDGARDFASGVNYNAGAFTTALCVARTKDTGSGRTATTGETLVEVDSPAAKSCTNNGSSIE